MGGETLGCPLKIDQGDKTPLERSLSDVSSVSPSSERIANHMGCKIPGNQSVGKPGLQPIAPTAKKAPTNPIASKDRLQSTTDRKCVETSDIYF